MSNASAIRKLVRFQVALKGLPRGVAAKVAVAVAPDLTLAALASFDRGGNAYGKRWIPLASGGPCTLVDTGRLRSQIQYVAVGNGVRVALGVEYAKYLVGRRPIFPSPGKPLPPAYVKAIKKATATVIRAELVR